MQSGREGAPAVHLDAVTKRFDDVTAVDTVELAIGDGEFFSLLGPSGCGKTTTLRMIAGLEFPTAGEIRIFGETMGLRPPNRRPVNTVFQSYALFPHMDVASNVAFGLRMRRVDAAERRRRVAEALELVQLGGYERRRPAQLSGGQQQRVALARALVNRPAVLLLDEPLGALDLKLRQEMQGELKTLQREVGITFVYVTHDQEEALTMSDRIGVMHQGRLLQVGTPEDVYERPRTRFVADFIGRTNFLDATVGTDGRLVLTDGTRLAVTSDEAPGTPVAVTIRPERLTWHRPDEAPTDRQRISGKVERTTYLGNAVVVEVAVSWMHLEIRSSDTARRAEPGEEVVVSFADADAVVVTDDAR
ncbi:MAG: ABC transporter ATP-binding protein [Actinomyces sp.]|nr:MAG: ABC transporter ATP-binding protein [Actinomyces sp.]